VGEQYVEARKPKEARTAGEAGWHVSRYNLQALVPGTQLTAIANLYKGTCARFTPLEMSLLPLIGEFREDHPLVKRFAERGVIANCDERAALEAMGRMSCTSARGIELTICPTMGCNFDCPYCFENHSHGSMPAQVQDDVVALAERMIEAAGARYLAVTWFGGEPLLAQNVVESLSTRLMALAEQREAEYIAAIITNGYLLTQEAANMLARCGICVAQVTLDGIGAAHDATRRLAGGGPTFQRIVSNLRDVRIPFRVDVRHNVHAKNLEEIDTLEAFVARLAQESGNDLCYYPTPVTENTATSMRGEQVSLLGEAPNAQVAQYRESKLFRAGRGSFCGAHDLWNVGIDSEGRLHKCWRAIEKTAFSFGNAHDWDPKDPLATASAPNNLTQFLNTALPLRDEECRSCVWLPLCVGGCPYQRLTRQKRCVPFKDDPQSYVLALNERMGESGHLSP